MTRIAMGCILAFISFVQILAGQETMNVVVLFTDDQRWNTIHALGNDEIHTPNLDRLVKMGVSFTNAHVTGSFHGAVCAPSRAMLLTGRPFQRIPREYIDQGMVPPDHKFDFITFPEQLKQLGYRTYITGKWHNHTSKIPAGFQDGRNLFIGGMHWPSEGGHRKPMLWDFDPSAIYARENRWQGEAFSSSMYTDAALDFLKSNTRKSPFCLYVAYTSPHDPREAPDTFRQRYDTADISLPPNYLQMHPFDNGHLRTRDENLLPFPRTRSAVRQEILEYYAMISEVDAQIGRILDFLEESGLIDSTILVFAGDNGLAVGQHGLLGKQNLYEHSVRVPLVIAAPGFPGGRRSKALCSIHDIYPTITDLLHIAPPAGVEGISLAPAMKGEHRFARDTMLLSHARQMRAVKSSDGLKLIRYFVKGETHEQLFDLSHDPWELNNLVDDPRYVKQLRKLRESLFEEILRSGDDFARLRIDASIADIGKPADITLSGSIPGASICYTLDGTEPTLQASAYLAPLRVSGNVEIRARMFYRNQPVGRIETLKVNTESSIRNIRIIPEPSEKYRGQGAYTLVNGANGTTELQTGQWIGYERESPVCTIELKQPKDIRLITIRYLDQPGNWIFPPGSVDLSFAGPNFQFSEKTVRQPDQSVPDGSSGVREWDIRVAVDQVQYIRLRFQNIETCPEWHPGNGKPAWLFLDEISIH